MTMTGHAWYDFLFLLPEKFVLIGYNTHPALAYESPIIRANAEFFLEPSFVSQFMALGILIEIIFFRVYWRMALYAGGLVASLSGTGFVLLGVVATYVMISRRQWFLIAAAVVALCLVATFQNVPILSEVLGRATEFQSERSSSFIRFIAPFVAIGDALGNDFMLWLGGVGPGQSKELIFDGYAVNPFVVSKLIIENGLIGCIPFVFAVTFCFFDRCFDRALAAGLYLMYMLLSGSLQQPHTVYLFLIISILFIPLAKADGARAEARRAASSAPVPA
jgi:hypothetical protein